MNLKGTALVKARDRFTKLMLAKPDQADFFRLKIQELEAQIITQKVCKRCGRPLTSIEAMENGYGKECAAKAEAMSSEEQ